MTELFFSDRPDRIVNSFSTSDFVGNWSTGEDSFDVDPPNTVLIANELEGKQDETIIGLLTQVNEQESKILKYNFILLISRIPIDSINFGSSTILIDFSKSQVTQVGDSISNLISQLNEK